MYVFDFRWFSTYLCQSLIFDLQIPARSIGSKNYFDVISFFGHLPGEGGDRGELSQAVNTVVIETYEK